MKRLIRKMTACFMALAMILALSVNAFADWRVNVTDAGSTGITSVSIAWTDDATDEIKEDLEDATVTLSTTDGSTWSAAVTGTTGIYSATATVTTDGTTITITDGSLTTYATLTAAAPATGLLASDSATFSLAYSAGSGSTTNWTSTDSEGTGSGTGVGKLEGIDPDKVINVILPVVGENTYDMYLDPHDLLNDTDWLRYGGSESLVWSGSDGRLFFNQGSVDVDSGGDTVSKTSYGNDSIALDVINRSQIDVTVTLDLAVTKSDGAESLIFTNSSGVSNASGAAMYLGVVAVSSNGAEADEDTSPADVGTEYITTVRADSTGSSGSASYTTDLPAVSVFQRNWDGSAEKYIYEIDDEDREDTDFNKLTFNLSGMINDSDAWDDMGDEPVSLELTWTVTEVVEEEDVEPTAEVTTTARAANGTAVITYDLGSGDSAATEVSHLWFNTTTDVLTNTSIVTNHNTDECTITVSVITALYNAGGNLTLEFDNGDTVDLTLR